MVRKVIQVVAGIASALLTLHGWYRALGPVQRKPFPKKKLSLKKTTPKSPVIIMASSKEEADEIAELLGDEHIVVGYITQRDLLA
jgi:uncharacterized protein (DUF697 family)